MEDRDRALGTSKTGLDQSEKNKCIHCINRIDNGQG